MDKQVIFNFTTDISKTHIPSELNNPFGMYVPEIAKIAAKEFQAFIVIESKKWKPDFPVHPEKTFGVLVIQKADHTYHYLGTISGRLPENAICNKFIPSIFDERVGDSFLYKGMTGLTEMSKQIKATNIPAEIISLKEKRKQKSIALQQRLFEYYNFINLSGKKKNIIEIFKDSEHGNPPSAAGECAAPKLLQYAFQHQLKPIALAEFRWEKPIEDIDKKHNIFYPACKDRCRPILEYMLEDTTLFAERTIKSVDNNL